MSASYPARRMRRLRRSAALRRLVAETTVTVDDLVAPLFLRDGIDEPLPIDSMPGVVQHTVASLVEEAKRLAGLGVPALVLFGVPDPAWKDETGSEAWNPDGIAQRGLSELRSALGDSMVIISDLCLDEYTDHGHCGVLRGIPGSRSSRTRRGGRSGDQIVDNDATLELYKRVAIAQALAGVDLVAPSGMMDGQVAAIRAALDSEGFSDTGILAYSAKFASALYGPFRDAAEVEIAGGGDRRSYQQDPRNLTEAVAEALLDVGEGADMVMVKPALAYLDVISAVREAVEVPVAAYHVSGEYAMVQAAAERGWLDGAAVAAEHVGSIKRAGASFVLTYFAAMLAEAMAG